MEKTKITILSILFIVLLALSGGSVCIAEVIFNEYNVDTDAYGVASLYIADIDNDGDNDIVGALIEDNDVIWWRNDGGEPVTWAKLYIDWNFSGARSVYPSDIDGDGDIDVVGAAYNIGRITWWSNEGDDPSEWIEQTISSNFILPHEVFAYDINSDGNMDVLCASSELDRVTVWYNNGSEPIVWSEQIIGENFGMAKSVAAGDINNDGNPDVVGAALEIGRVSWWQSDGNNPIGWTEHIIDNSFWGAHRVQVIDLDQDGDLDIVGAAYFGNEIAWWRNDEGEPIVWTKQTVGAGLTNACVAYAEDIDGDDNIDIAGSAQGRDELAWWKNNGQETIEWEKFTINDDFLRVWPVCIGDIDGDSRNDLVAGSSHNGSNEVKWWRNIEATSIDDRGSSKPDNVYLLSSAPNPFNTSTTISFSLAKYTKIELAIYDITGKLVVTLIHQLYPAGTHSVDWNADGYTSGVYFIRLKTSEMSQSKKLILLK